MLPFRAVALGAGLLAASALTAVAAPIEGTLGIAGAYRAEDAAGNLTTLGNAVAIDFTPVSAGTSGPGEIIVTTSGGDLAGIAKWTVGTILDLFLAPFSGPVAGFFSVGGLTFDLESVEIVSQTDDGLILRGTGKMHYAGYDVTIGTWGASFNDAGGGPGSTGEFSWSSDIASAPGPTPVPEPASLALFGAGLLGLGLAGRRKA